MKRLLSSLLLIKALSVVLWAESSACLPEQRVIDCNYLFQGSTAPGAALQVGQCEASQLLSYVEVSKPPAPEGGTPRPQSARGAAGASNKPAKTQKPDSDSKAKSEKDKDGEDEIVPLDLDGIIYEHQEGEEFYRIRVVMEEGRFKVEFYNKKAERIRPPYTVGGIRYRNEKKRVTRSVAPIGQQGPAGRPFSKRDQGFTFLESTSGGLRSKARIRPPYKLTFELEFLKDASHRGDYEKSKTKGKSRIKGYDSIVQKGPELDVIKFPEDTFASYSLDQASGESENAQP